MTSKKIVAAAVLASATLAFLGARSYQQWREAKETSRMQSLLLPVIAQAVEGTAEPRPELQFAVVTEKSVQVVLRWEQKIEAALKNEMRDRVSAAIRREAAADPKSWGRYVSVIFQDEVVTQGWK